VDELVSAGKFWESDALNRISQALRNWDLYILDPKYLRIVSHPNNLNSALSDSLNITNTK
jgi:hypothetical protein